MARNMQRLVETQTLAAEKIREMQGDIYSTILRESEFLDTGNFTTIHPDDIEHLFDLYDDRFFEGGFGQALHDAPLDFRLSKRMTRAGGQTRRRGYRDRRGGTVKLEYEIAISTTLLFQTFQEDHRPVVMSGIDCRDRLEALQRIMEHEITHLAELLIWENSSCTAPRFQSVANRFFGHTDHRHQLITPRELAFTKFGIKCGDRVSFQMDGEHYVGRINRITKRTTVLVEDHSGQRYSDGKRYAKFYVPVGMLETVKE